MHDFARRFSGIVRSWNPDGGFGFIVCSESRAIYNKDWLWPGLTFWRLLCHMRRTYFCTSLRLATSQTSTSCVGGLTKPWKVYDISEVYIYKTRQVSLTFKARPKQDKQLRCHALLQVGISRRGACLVSGGVWRQAQTEGQNHIGSAMGFAEKHVNCQYFALFLLRSLTCYFAERLVASAEITNCLYIFIVSCKYITWSEVM